MEITLQDFAFCVVALFIAVFSVLTVTTRRMLRAATFLLFVLFGTSAIYFLLGYTFLGAAQLIVYAGGIVVLYVFSILLTNSKEKMSPTVRRGKLFAAIVSIAVGAFLTLFLVLTNKFALEQVISGDELTVDKIGHALVGGGKYQFVLPFEVVSMLLLACIIGGLVIGRKR